MRPTALIIFAAILVSLAVVFLAVGRGLLDSNPPADTANPEARSSSERPILMTVSAVILIGLFVASLFIGREVILPQDTADVLSEQTQATPPPPPDQEDLRKSAQQVDRAADEIYHGLEKTQRIIGKTKSRADAIESGREHASDKLKALSDRIEDAAEQNQPLQPFDRKVVDHMTKGLSDQ